MAEPKAPKAVYSNCVTEGFTDDEVEFLKAMERFKREHGRPFPSWREVLQVIEQLGYRKVAPKESIPRPRDG